MPRIKKTKPVISMLCGILVLISSIRAQQLPIAAMQSDFDILRSALEESHGGLYRYSTKAEMDKIFIEYRRRLNQPLTKAQFFGIVAELFAATRDGHMRLEYDESTVAALAKAKLFPLRLVMDQGKLRIVFNDSPGDSTILPGMELVSVNGHPVEELITSLLPKLPADGFIQTGKRKRLNNNFGQLYHLYIDTASVFQVRVKDGSGKPITASLNGVTSGEREKNAIANPVNTKIREAIATMQASNPKPNVSLRMLENNSVALMRIKSFSGDSYYAAIDSVFKALQDAKTNVLILDLRGNGGGVDEYGAYLVAQFTNKPFRYFDRIHVPTINPSFTTWPSATIEDMRTGTVADPTGGFLLTPKRHPGLAEQEPGKYPFLKKLIVLIDGGTFSTAADAAAQMRSLTPAIFVGEETGGGYEGNTSGMNAQLKLPESKLSLRIHQYDYYNAVKPAKMKGRGIMPDHEVPFSMADLFKGIDAQLEKAVELGRRVTRE